MLALVGRAACGSPISSSKGMFTEARLTSPLYGSWAFTMAATCFQELPGSAVVAALPGLMVWSKFQTLFCLWWLTAAFSENLTGILI